MSFWRRFGRKKATVAAAAVFVLFLLMALVGPFLCRYSPTAQDVENRLSGPSLAHPLGTDYVGRDLLTRVVYGAQASIGAGLISALCGGTVGVVLGLLAGYLGRVADGVISRGIELLMALPGILLAILVVTILGAGTRSTIIAVSIMLVPSFARLTRGAVLGLRQAGFIQACQLMGASDSRIMLRHILPNCLPMILINLTLSLGTAVVTTSSLSFVGLGVPAPQPEWGSMMFAAKQTMRSHPLGLLAPGLAVTLFVMSASLVGDGLRDAFDPKLKR